MLVKYLLVGEEAVLHSEDVPNNIFTQLLCDLNKWTVVVNYPQKN